MGAEARTNPFSKENSKPYIDGIVDLRGRKLEIGDEVMLNTGNPIFFRVIAINPVLDPKAPPGLMQIEVAAAIHFYAPKNKVQLEFIRTRTAEEAGPMNVFKPEEGAEGLKL